MFVESLIYRRRTFFTARYKIVLLWLHMNVRCNQYCLGQRPYFPAQLTTNYMKFWSDHHTAKIMQSVWNVAEKLGLWNRQCCCGWECFVFIVFIYLLWFSFNVQPQVGSYIFWLRVPFVGSLTILYAIFCEIICLCLLGGWYGGGGGRLINDYIDVLTK